MFVLNIKFVDDNLYAQRCFVPQNHLKNSVLKPGDIVSIHCGSRFIICRIFSLPPMDLEKSILISNSVWCNVYPEEFIGSFEKKQLLFPNDISVLKVTSFEQIQIKLILHNLQASFTENLLYQNVASKLLQQLVICKGATVHCSGLAVANMFNIQKIIITETNHEEYIYGRLSRTASIEISEVLFEEQSNSIEKLELGGIHEAKKLLNFYLFQQMCKRVVVTGPSGCGKSVLVKKFCYDLKCGLVTIDVMKKSTLTTEKCDAYFKYLTEYSNRDSTNNLSFLLIDDLDKLASSESKQGMFSDSLSIIVKLLKKLKGSNVYVIATAVQKKSIHPSLASSFEEVFLGIPSIEQRRDILKVCTKSPDCSQIDFDKVAAMLPGFVACDIAQLAEKVIKRKEGMDTPNELPNAKSVITTTDFEEALVSFIPSILRSSEWSLKVQKVHWSDIGGMVKIKERLQMCIEKPLLNPELFEKVGLQCPTGVLLFGPPGCCKTTLARGLATECQANFFAANPSQIYSAYVGESEKNISQLFYQARLCAPSIIFLDELDSLVGYRDMNTKQQGVAEKVLSTLLNEMDGSGIRTDFGKNNYDILDASEEGKNVLGKKMKNEVIVVAATNRPDCIDSALLRPGRFDVILYVPPPNFEERVSILQTITEGIPLRDVDFKIIAEKTEFFTGADLKNLYNMVAMNALRQDIINAEYITQDHFMEALKNIQPSITKEQVHMYEQLSTKYGPVISE